MLDTLFLDSNHQHRVTALLRATNALFIRRRPEAYLHLLQVCYQEMNLYSQQEDDFHLPVKVATFISTVPDITHVAWLLPLIRFLRNPVGNELQTVYTPIPFSLSLWQSDQSTIFQIIQVLAGLTQKCNTSRGMEALTLAVLDPVGFQTETKMEWDVTSNSTSHSGTEVDYQALLLAYLDGWIAVQETEEEQATELFPSEKGEQVIPLAVTPTNILLSAIQDIHRTQRISDLYQLLMLTQTQGVSHDP